MVKIYYANLGEIPLSIRGITTILRIFNEKRYERTGKTVKDVHFRVEVSYLIGDVRTSKKEIAKNFMINVPLSFCTLNEVFKNSIK